MNRINTSQTGRPPLIPLDILEVQSDFEARTANELTIKEGNILFILSDGVTDGWVLARCVSHIHEDPSKEPSGLVPRSCLRKIPPEWRGRALYEYTAGNENCVRTMGLGQKMDIYARLGECLLVKLDGFDGEAGRTGYVPKLYVEIFDDNDDEVLRPLALKAPPREYCYLCESSVRYANYFECTRCRLPNGDPFYICCDCAYQRKALFVHQVAKGGDHLFSRGTSDAHWDCVKCWQPTSGSASLVCLACPGSLSSVFELCYSCYKDPGRPHHEHHLIPISAEGTLLENQVESMLTIKPQYIPYICNGCRRDISRYVLVCKTCPNSRFKLCAECAELDRATFLHDRWTGGVPHEFQVIDRHT